MPTPPEQQPLINAADMKVVERVLMMGSGYVLDLNNQEFDEFIAREVGVDATAPRCSVDGSSKAKRLRRILHSLAGADQAKLLRAFLEYRDSPARKKSLDLLDDEWRQLFQDIIVQTEQKTPEPSAAHASSSWTGRRTVREQITIVREIAPIALREIDTLANIVERERFNDPITADAIDCLRDLHRQLGELLNIIDSGAVSREAVERIERDKERLALLIKEGAKLTVVAPAMTLGIMHLLSWLSGSPIDSTLVSSVFATIVGADALKSLNKKTSIAAG